jgi:Ca2+-binding EF-hand superfamily protein
MKKYLIGGVAFTAIVGATAALAQTAQPVQPAPAAKHGRPFFNKPEARTDVQAHVQRMFARLDTNRDGFISKDEIAAAETQFQAKAQQQAPKRAAKLFARLDGNHDGQITLAEVQAAHAARFAARGNQANPQKPVHSRLFDRADANKDGVITRGEFDAAMANGGLHFRQAGLHHGFGDRMFATADTDKDGRVSLAEAQALALQHFDQADLNHDGTLTPDERKQVRQLNRGKHRPS